MQGFSEEFVDIVDYIVRITSWIWDDRRPERCLDYYGDDCIIHTLAAEITGVDTVIQGTKDTLSAFPDRTLDAENVIWGEVSSGGYYTSHLITSEMTNLGASEYGPATGIKAQIFTIADCVCVENRIVEEWLVRDNLGLVTQLGYDGYAIAQQQALLDMQNGDPLASVHLDEWHRVQDAPAVDPKAIPAVPEADVRGFVEAVFALVWQQKALSRLAEVYDFRVRFNGPNSRYLYGPQGVKSDLLSLQNAFPDAKVSIDHIADIPYLGDAKDVAVRWTLAGTHSGDGERFGAASQTKVRILGVTHWRIIGGQIHQEWSIFDELAVLRQIARGRLT